MGKFKKPLVVVLAIIVAGTIAGGFVLYNKKNNDSPKEAVAIKTQSPQEIKAEQDRMTAFNDVINAYSTKDYEKVIVAAQSFGKTTAGATEKLNAYNLCMLAATELKQQSPKKTCYDSAKELANTLTPVEEKTQWLGTLDDTYNGTNNFKGVPDDQNG